MEEKITRNALEDGTIEYRNSKGELHREDGPAIELADGTKSWYINGKSLTEEEFKGRINKDNSKTDDNISKTFDQNFTYESKIFESIKEFKKYLKNK